MVRRKRSNLQKEKERGQSTSSAASREPTRRRRSSSSQPTKFSNYIFKVLKQVHPQLSMTNKAMKVMDDFMHDIYSRLVAEAAGLVKLTRRSTLSAAEFQTATRLLLPGELAKHAISDGTKAVQNFLRSRNEDSVKNTARREARDPDTSLNSANNQEPVEIEIFGTVPKPLLNDSREIPLSNSDIEEYMEEGIEEDIEEDDLEKDSDPVPRQELFPSRSTHAGLKGTVKEPIQHISKRNLIRSSTDLGTTPVNSSMDESLIESASIPIRKNIPGQFEENIADREDDQIHRLLERPAGPPTPPTEAESDTSVSSSVTLDKQLMEDSSNCESLDKNDRREVSMEEAETVTMESRNSRDVEPLNPVVTVHVEVMRSGNPTVISDVTVLSGCDNTVSPDSSNTQSNSSKHASSCSTSLHIGGQTDSGPTPVHSKGTDIEVNPVLSCADSSNSIDTSESRQTTAVRFSKVLTTKTTFIHERNEHSTEWLSGNESFN